MKTRLFLILGFVLMGFIANSQDVKAYLNFNKFYSPKDGPYIETYISIDGQTVTWVKNEEGKFTAEVEVTLIFEKDSNIVDYSKLIINSGEIKDSSEMRKQFMNIQRFALSDGDYIVKIKLDDIHDTLEALFTHGEIGIDIPLDTASISSIEAVQEIHTSIETDQFSHSGYNLIPNIYNYFPNSDSNFIFYAELYHVNKSIPDGETYLLNYYITNFETDVVLEKFKVVERRQAKDIDVVLSKFNIVDLPTGNFMFKIEVINKSNNIIAENSYFIQRENNNIKINPEDVQSINIINTFAELITGKDTLIDVIRAMRPISSNMESDFAEGLIKKGDIHVMQQYIYQFWYQRNINEPSKPFIRYMKEVMKVNNEFGTSIKRGYESDRGYVYLKYGEPNNINQQYNEPATYPYEIWQYYGVKGQSNVRFIFFNPDLVTNDFQLLHSNAIGEVNDYQWRLRLRKRDQGYRSIDQTGEATDDWGTHYNEYYNEPR